MTGSPPIEGPCAYCGERRAIHRDHVIPASLQRKLRRMGKTIPAHLKGTALSCGRCNWLKYTRRLVPASWAEHLDELNALIPWGSRFRVWNGDPKAEAFTRTWL